MSLFLLSVLFLLGCTEAKKPLLFKWEQCGTPDYVSVHKLSITPDPIEIPGKIMLNLNYTIHKSINDADVYLSMYKELLWGSIHVPCVFHMGSCTYKNTCSLVDTMEKKDWGGMSSSMATQLKKAFDDRYIDTSCPQTPKNVDLQEVELTIPPNYYGPIWNGSYKVKIMTTDKTVNKEVLCLKVQFTLKSPG